MAHFTLPEANAWLESTKLTLTTIDPDLEKQLAEQVLARLRGTFDSASTWTNEASTPTLVRSIIAMLYCAAVYERSYGDNHEDTNNYAGLLRSAAESNIVGLITGVLELTEDTGNLDSGTPAFYPTDVSSAACPTDLDPSAGGPYFTMGQVF